MKLCETVLKVGFVALLFSFLAYFVLSLMPIGTVRPLGEFYLLNSFNASNQSWWTGSPNSVTGLLWDYRGTDTLFETMVFYIGIVAVSIFFERATPSQGRGGMSLIVRASTRLVFIFILTSAIAITIFSVKTPGGGFQGGSILAVGYVSILVALSRDFLPSMGLDSKRAHMYKIAGLFLISIFAVAPIIFSIMTGMDAYAMQNLPKSWSVFGYLSFWGLQSLSGGSIIPIQMGEMLHVGMGFTVVFLLLSLKENGHEGETAKTPETRVQEWRGS